MKQLSINYRLKKQKGYSRFRTGTNTSKKLAMLNIRKLSKLVSDYGYTDRSGKYLQSLLYKQAGTTEVQKFRYIDKLQKKHRKGKLNLLRNLQHLPVFKQNRKYTNLKGENYLDFVLHHNEKRFNYEEWKQELQRISKAGGDTNLWVEKNFYSQSEQVEFQAKRKLQEQPPNISIEQWKKQIQESIKVEGNKFGRLAFNRVLLKEIKQEILLRNIPWF